MSVYIQLESQVKQVNVCFSTGQRAWCNMLGAALCAFSMLGVALCTVRGPGKTGYV